MHSLIYIVMSLIIGAMLAVYLPMNTAISRYLGSPITASIIFFFIALLSTIIIFLIWGEFDTLKKVKEVPAWLYLSGIASALMIVGTTFLISKIGVRRSAILTVSGQILMAIIISHFGAFGTPRDLITIKKLFGAVCIVVGILFSTI